MRDCALALVLLTASTGAAAAVLYEADFDTFAGRGFSPLAFDGGLSSLAWQVEGLSEGDTLVGGVHLSGDYARGRSPGGVSRGGVYGFEVDAASGDVALGLQATGSDLTPGAVVLGWSNPFAVPLHQLALEYVLWWRNDGARSTSVDVTAALASGAALTAQGSLSAATPAPATAGSGWESLTLSGSLVGAPLLPGDALTVRWDFADALGTGSRDEIAIDNVKLFGLPLARAAVPAPGTSAMALWFVLAATGLVLRRRARARFARGPGGPRP